MGAVRTTLRLVDRCHGAAISITRALCVEPIAELDQSSYTSDSMMKRHLETSKEQLGQCLALRSATDMLSVGDPERSRDQGVS